MPARTMIKSKQLLPVLRTYFKAARAYPWLLAVVVIGGIVIEVTNVGSAYILKHLIDALSTYYPSEDAGAFVLTTLGWFGLVAFAGWCGQRFRQFGLTRIEPKVMQDLSASAFKYLIGHSHDFFNSNFAGSLTRRVQRYARSFESVLDNFSFNFFSAFLYASGVLFVLTSRSALLGGIVFAWIVIFIGLQVLMARWRQPLRVARAVEDSKVTGSLSDAITNYSAINFFASERYELGLYTKALDRWRIATLRSWIADNWIWGIQGLFVIAIQVILLGAGVVLWSKGLLSVGDFVLVQLYIIGLIDRIWNIGNAVKQLYDAAADAHEMIEILEAPHAVADRSDATTLVVNDGVIAFADVGFNFKDDRMILSDFDLTIQGGEKIALVGPSGAGKSTITKLILRQHDVTSGSVAIDGQDIRKVTQESLRQNIGFVPQDPALFHRTLRENIAYGKPDATEEEIIDAAKKAHCHEFISNLHDGYDTYVGERGVKLSGGERQRVAIARAILKNAPILILDEATSALDSESEALIQDALRTLMEGKTAIVIAHRLSTIMKMDRIIVIEAGKIAAEGTHDELVRGGGLYKKLWSIQAGSFIADESLSP